jgi:hypothetical protein
MMRRLEVALLEREGIGLSLRREGQKTHEELVIAGLFTLLQQRFGVVRLFKVAVAVVPAVVTSEAVCTSLETKPVGLGL